MILTNEALLDRFRAAPRCEWCGCKTLTGCDPAHVYSRGAGRVDIAMNLVALCRYCHTSSHGGNLPRVKDLLEIVAKREKVKPEDVLIEVERIRRLPKRDA